MQSVLNSDNIPHKFLYDDESLMLSSFIATPVFTPVERKMTQKKALCEFEIMRTKNERVFFSGVKLDLHRDYPLFHLIMREKQLSGKLDFFIKENALCRALGIQSRKSNKEDLDRRIKKMMTCSIQIEKLDSKGNAHKKIYASMIDWVEWDIINKTFQIKLSDKLFRAEEAFDYEVIKLSAYRQIRSQYARALFLLYESYKFLTHTRIVISMSKLSQRLGDNNMALKYLHQEVKKANKELIELGYLDDCSYFNNKQKQPVCEIVRAGAHAMSQD
jgi:hypothetical protein